MAKYTNIDKGPRGLNTSQGKVWVDPGETVDVDLAKGETAPKDWFKSAGGERAKQPETGLRAAHHGGGKFNVVDGDTVLLTGLPKADADAFNAMTDEDKRAYVEASKG